jgi:2-oxoglutarate/2-oxoacid ferredoxin oxidoreductase subunit alpha
MKLNITVAGRAGQGVNKITQILANTLNSYGYYTFNYRDYSSLIRGGHNFNTLCIADFPIESHDSKINILIALDENSITHHKSSLTKGGIIIKPQDFASTDQNLNAFLASSATKALGIPFIEFEKQIKKSFDNPQTLRAAREGYAEQAPLHTLPKTTNKNIKILSGSQAVATGAIKSGLDLYIAYPMTPATGVMNELAKDQLKNNLLVFQSENEIAAASMALGASFTGKKVMTGTSGGGFDLMSETFSMQGISEIPLTVYLASRPGPGTGVPTYTSQADLDIATHAGHGEFPRIVIAPGNPIETIEKTSEALFLAEKFRTLSIILSDKHLAESEYSSTSQPSKCPTFNITRPIPGSALVKNSSYETNQYGNSTESYRLTEQNQNNRTKKYSDTKKYIRKNFEMIKIHGKKKSKNLIIGWGSTSGAIKDAIKDLDAKFLQVIYTKPLSPAIKKEIQKADKVILIECNVTGQLGKLIQEKTGAQIHNKILKYNGRPFHANELNKLIRKIL